MAAMFAVVDARWRCWPSGDLDPDCQTTCEYDISNYICQSLCKCVADEAANDTCAPLDFAPRGQLEVMENLTAGTPLFELPVTSGEQWEYQLGRSDLVDGSPWRELRNYLKFSRYANKYEMILHHALDLEYIYDLYGIKLTALKLILTCQLGGSDDSQTKEIYLLVKPVNEYAPEFKNLPLYTTVPESTRVGSYVFILRSRAIDKDVNPTVTELDSFHVWKYMPDDRRDGRAYFTLNDTRMGSIVLQKSLDFESLSSVGATTFFLNVSASDVHGLMTFATLTLRVQDVDDLPPEFYHPGCPLVVVRSRPCLVSYQARVPLKFQGQLTNMSPGPVHARDMDSLNASIVYSLEAAPGETPAALEKFVINATSGSVHLVSAFMTAQVVELVIVARELSGAARSTQASLQVSAVQDNSPLEIAMLRPKPNLPEDSTSKSPKQDLPLYLIITLTVGLLLVATHVVLCLLCLRYKGQHHPRVEPHPSDREGSRASLRHSHHGSVASLNTRNPPGKLTGTAPFQTHSYLQTTEYSVGQDGTVSESRMSLRYDNKSLPPDAKVGQDTLLLGQILKSRKGSKPLSVENGPAGEDASRRATLENGSIASNPQAQLQSNGGQHRQSGIARGDRTMPGPHQEENLEYHEVSSLKSNATPESSSASSLHVSTGRRTRSYSEARPTPTSIPGFLLQRNSTPDLRTLDGSHNKDKQGAELDREHRAAAVLGTGEANNNWYGGYSEPQSLCKETVHKFDSVRPTPIGDATARLASGDVDISTSMTSVSEPDEGSTPVEHKLECISHLEAPKQPHSNTSVPGSGGCGQQLKADVLQVDPLVAHDALSLFPLEKASVVSDDGNLGTAEPLAKAPQQTRAEVGLDSAALRPGNVCEEYTVNQWPSTDLLMARPYTGPGHGVRPEADPSLHAWQEQTIEMPTDGGRVRPETGPPLGMKRKKKKKKKDRRERRSNEQDTDSYTDTYLPRASYPDNSHDYAYDQAIWPHNRGSHGQQGSFDCRLEPDNDSHNSRQSWTGSVGSGFSPLQESDKNPPTDVSSGVKVHRPYDSTRSIAQTQKGSVRLDKSRLQPYMVQRHEQYKQQQQELLTQRLQQQEQKQQQRTMHQRQLQQIHQYQTQQQQRQQQQDLEQNQVHQNQQHPTQKLLFQNQLQLAHQQMHHQQQDRSQRRESTRRSTSAAEQHPAEKAAQDDRSLPSTAPALANFRDSSKQDGRLMPATPPVLQSFSKTLDSSDQNVHGSEHMDPHVKNWVNSTH